MIANDSTAAAWVSSSSIRRSDRHTTGPTVHPTCIDIRAEVGWIVHRSCGCSTLGAKITGHLAILEMSRGQIVIFNELSHVVFHDILVASQEFFLTDNWCRILLAFSIFILNCSFQLLV